ncbi:hypothetical protein DRO53_00650 [Candidatus Bathyarchaeota archaeon]|nr:MAG: hypothetical protein DRO53_00650 [Candidatus Bathyarchaeota archaeon]
MYVAALIVDLAMFSLLFLALWKDRVRALNALAASLRMLVELLPFFVLIIVVIGVTSNILTFELISRFIGSKAGLKGLLIAALIGTVVHIPSLVAPSGRLPSAKRRGGRSRSRIHNHAYHDRSGYPSP